MKYLLIGCCLSVIIFAFSPPFVVAAPEVFLNRIEGQIFDENRVTVGEVYVELQNDSGSTLSTKRATSLGRFTFLGLTSGSYIVRVLPSGKNLLEQSKDLQFIPSMSGRSEETQFIEFYLKIDKRAANIANVPSPDTVYAQDIPEIARKLYKSGVDSLSNKQDKGLTDLESAIAISPIYFDALSRLGKEYVIRKDYEKAYPYLMRAIDVNSRNYSSYYALGFAFYQLKQIPAAIKAAEACTIIRSDITEGHVLYGTLLRISGSFQESEKELKKAIAISKEQNAQAHWQMALLYNRLNRNKEAADELEIYLKIAPAEATEKKAAQDLIAKLRAAKQN